MVGPLAATGRNHGGAIVDLQKTGAGRKHRGHQGEAVLNSRAVSAGFKATNSYLVPQAFPKLHQPIRRIRPGMAQWREPARCFTP